MKVAFKVDRIGYYRLFAPLIDHALSCGADVVLLHRDAPDDRSGPKAYQWADPAKVPAFRSGSPAVLQYRSEGELVDVAGRAAPDALVTIWAWSEAAACEALRDRGVTWAALQESHEFHVFPVDMLLRPDVTCMFSEWWIDLVERYYGVARDRLRSRLVATGWPELDALAAVDRAGFRARHGIAADAPVVTLASYKQHADDPWEQLVFRSGSRATAALRALSRGRFGYLRSARAGILYVELLRAVRAFCDRNGAVFVSKSRGKDRPPHEELRLADIALQDEAYYPATILELSAVSDVVVSFLSTATLEAVYAGALSVCPMPPEESEWLRAPASVRFRELLGYRRPGSIWNAPGVVEQIGVPEMIRGLGAMRLADLRPDPEARRAYVARYLHAQDAEHSARTWRAIAEAVERKRRA